MFKNGIGELGSKIEDSAHPKLVLYSTFSILLSINVSYFHDKRIYGLLNLVLENCKTQLETNKGRVCISRLNWMANLQL